MQKLIIPPDRDGYNFLDPVETISIQLDGGASKYRKDILNSNFKLNVQWSLSPFEFNYIKTFFNIFTDKGSLPFLLDLFIDNPYELTEHECNFIPGTFGLTRQSGNLFVVKASLEVKPVAQTQENIDQASIYALFGEPASYYIDLFDIAINTTLPGIVNV